MKQVFAPGCALVLYKPHLGKKVLTHLNRRNKDILEYLTCCHHEPVLPKGTQVINICPGCDRRYRELYEGISTISLWEILADSRDFYFPDYNGKIMTIHDACPTRTETRVLNAVRTLLNRMNIKIIEPELTRTNSICCGDTFYGKIPVEKVKEQMKKRAEQMPSEDVVVYCVSCVKSMFNGGKKPHYLVDLLFGEETLPGTLDPDAWHSEVDRFIESH